MNTATRDYTGFLKDRRFIAGLFFVAALSIFAVNHASAATRITKTVDGIKATLTISPNMLDLLLVDSGTGRTITDAKVHARVVHPKGHKVKKELVGMKMGDVYSYMNSVDTSQPGTYTFHIVIERGKKTVHFDAKKELK